MADTTTKILSVELQATSAINGIRQLNEAIEANKARMKELASENKKGSDEYAKYEQQLKSLSRAKQSLSRETQNEIKLQTEEKGSLNALRAELSNLTKQYDSLSRAERENINVGGKLKNQINQVTTEIKRAEEGTQRYYRNVGNYKNAIFDAIGLNSRFGQSLQGLVNTEGGIKGAFSAMGTSVRAFGATLSSLLTNPAFLAIAGIAGAGMAFKWFYDYNKGIAEATRHTEEFLHLTGTALQNMRVGIQATADTYGKEYMDVLKAVDLATAHWHITAQDALDAINKGFASGADLNGNMLQLLGQYAAPLKDAGFELEQVLALIQQTRSGIFSEAGLEAIKQAGARLRNMSNSTKESLQGIGIDADDLAKKLASGQMEIGDAIKLVASKLKEVGVNSQQAGSVMADVFGKQGKFASAEMIRGLEDIETNLDIVMQKTGDWGNDMEELRDKNEQLEKAVADLFDVTGQSFEHTTNQAKIFYKDGLLRIISGVRDAVKWFGNLWNSTKAVRIGMTALITLWRVLGQVAYAPLRLIILGIKTIGDALAALSNALLTIKKNIGTAFNGLAEIFKGIREGDPEQVFNGIKKAANGAWSAVKSFGTGMTNTLDAAFRSVKGGAADMARSVAGSFSHIDDMMNYRFNVSDDSYDVPSYSTDYTESGGGSTSSSSSSSGSSNKGNKGGNKNKATTTKKTGKTDQEKKDEQIAKEKLRVAQQLIAQANRVREAAEKEMEKTNRENIALLFEQRVAELNKQYEYILTITAEQEKNLTDEQKKTLLEARTTYGILLKGLEDERDKAYKDYDAQVVKERAEREKKAADMAKTYVSNMLSSTTEGTQQWLNLYLQQLKLTEEEELKAFDANNQLKTSNLTQWLETRKSIQAKYDQQRLEAQRTVANYEVEIQEKKTQALGSIIGGLGEIFGAFGEEQEEFVALQKTLALAEIMINQAVSISNAITAATTGSITVWDMIAKIAVGITAVTTAMVQAFTSLNSAKFATGGYIKGAGTSTSDSIPIRVSNGESVMNANTTAMFSGLLSSLNQLGGGAPIQAQQTAASVRGEDMLARAVARGVAMLPAPVVSVEDINKGQRQVKVMNDRATL